MGLKTVIRGPDTKLDGTYAVKFKIRIGFFDAASHSVPSLPLRADSWTIVNETASPFCNCSNFLLKAGFAAA